MNKNKNKSLICFSFFLYTVCAAFMIYGTIYDTQINMALFNPQSSFAVTLEAFGQSVLWLMWGPLFSVLFLTRHSLNGYLEIFSRFLPFIKPLKNTETKAYKAFDTIIRIITGVLFFVLCVIGWKKPVQNILKHMLDLNDIIYFAISAALAVISIFLFSRLKKESLNKLEYLCASALLLGILLKFAEELKPLTHRVRFREMVAYSNGILDENGMSHGTFTKLSPVLEKDMKNIADLSAFTRWYKIGDDMGIYAKADSFPSGHVMNSCGVFLTNFLLRANEKLKKLSPLALVFSLCYVSVMALSRIIAGAHYLTDVTFGIILGYSAFLCAYAFLGFIKNKTKI